MPVPLLLADVGFFPYQSGNTVVDILLWGLWVLLFGFFFTLGQRIGNKIP